MEENKNLSEEVIPAVEETQAAEVVAVEETVVEEVVAEAAPVAVEEEAPVAEEVIEAPEAEEVIEAPEAEEVVETAVAEEVVETAVAEEVAPVAEEVVEVIEEAPAKVVIMAAPASVNPEADFDWEAYEKGDVLTAQQKEDLKNVYDNTLNAIKDKEVVEGTVISINKREVVVNVGYKSDGIVPMSEFRYNPDLAVGDKVEVYIESQEDKKGQLLLSHKQARATRSWDRVNAALESQEIVKGFGK